jgi:CheY-like chemotaxis protein
VLAVEDEPDIAELLGAFFRASGLGLVHVNPRGVDAVMDAIVEHQPKCVLLDLNLAGFSGLDVLEAIRHNPVHADLPVLVVTADSRPSTLQRTMQLGATAFVAKPFSVSELFAQVLALADADAPPTASDAPASPPARDDEDDVHERLTAVLGRAKRSGAPVSFALVRAAGTEAAVVQAVRDFLPDAVVGRGEPDEIAVIVTGLDAEAATATLARHLPGCGPDVRAGVAAAPTHAATADQLYMAADAALAEAIERAQAVVAAR